MSFSRGICAALLMAAVFSACAQEPQSGSTPMQEPGGQSQQRSPATPSQNPPAAHQAQSEEELTRKEQSQRFLKVIPRFNVTSRKDAAPLTPGGKFRLFARTTFDPFSFAVVGFDAGINQAANAFPEYGQGAQGYGKRYGASFADAASSSFFAGFFYPALLKQDPRYFRLGEGGIGHRIGYSLASEFICRTDKGKRSVNWSNILGAFSSGALSNTYYPRSDRGAELTASRSALSLAYGSASGLLDEFWPDIEKKIFRKRRESKPRGPRAAPAPE